MKPCRLRLTAVCAGIAIGCLTPVGARALQGTLPDTGISLERYLDHVQFLASPEMEGRGNGTPELDRAADYIAGQFEALGLEPAGDDGTWFQAFEVVTDTELGASSALVLGGETVRPDGFTPLLFSSADDVTAPLVFVGYGITAPEMHWDDYANVDVEGKIAVVFRHEPQENVPESPFNGTDFTTHASLRNKAVNAKQHGAAGVLFIMDPNNHEPDEDNVAETARGTDNGDSGIAVAYVERGPVLELFDRAGFDLSGAQVAIDTQLMSQSFELPRVIARLRTDVVRIRKEVRNVLGAVRGSDPELSDEWVIAGAHYDHLGRDGQFSLDPEGDGLIHHGADDNASGTAGVLEMARLAASNREQLERSVLFMAFAGEEIGLLGSSHFVNHPTIDIDNVAAMLNLDMIGRIRNERIYVSGVGTSPGFESMLTELSSDIPLGLDFSESGMNSSDHLSFNVREIPVLFFFSGLHGDYHRPTDTADKINADGAGQVVQLAYRTLDRLAEVSDRPVYTEVVEARPVTGSGGGYGPYFGSVPDFRDDLGGVLFADVRSGSPAGNAGLEAGDLLVEFAGKTVENLYDFTYALQAQAPGDVISVVVVRNGARLTREVTLEAR